MIFGSLFSGVGGFDLGFERAGLECAWQVELDSHCLEVLAEHFPNAERYTDVRTVGKHNLKPVDLICGGFPCQDLSVAGKRAGFDGERSSLWFEFERIIDELRPKWVVIENVPGLLSSKQGRDFGFILNALDERGYGVAWRVLDSQNFGVAQRRRRVFVVGSLGDASCAEILFESEGMPGDIGQSKEIRQAVAGTLTVRAGTQGEAGQCFAGVDEESAPVIELRAVGHSGGETLKFNEKVNTLNAQTGSETTATFNGVWQMNHASEVYRDAGDKVPTLQSRMGTGGNNVPLVGVRRLTPTECERLQGFPEIERSVTINVCLDNQKKNVNVETKNLKKQKPVGSAGKTEQPENAKSAESYSSTSCQQTEKPVVVNVLYNSGRGVLQIRNQEKLLLSVNTAEKKNLSHLPMQIEDFVQLIVHIVTMAAKITNNGVGESQPNTINSILRWNGKNVVTLSGEEIGELAADAERFTKMAKNCSTSTILPAEQSFQDLEQTLITWCYCAASAITLFIPGITQITSSYAIKLTEVSGWTASCSDAQRYKQMGNAVTVNVIEWIAGRIMSLASNGN